MKILAIRGRNLASLADDFAVDFETEPLAGAGVFAITGPTGAGKSTLLDTLALALFHDTPRLGSAGESGVDIPDASDHSLSSRDARNILRRGCGDARAEVDFIGIDGKRWRACWEVNRAYGRPDGRLQTARATLINLSDDRTVGGTLTETRTLIQEKLGLSYQQFCRSVLLAQNEFAAFLRARANERAELLEALTGTEIYRRISRLCHQRTRQEQDALKRIEEKLAIEPPLDDTARTALEARLEKAEQSLRAAEKTYRALQAEQQWHQQDAALQAQLQRHREDLNELTRALAARADEREKVARLEAIDPARPLYETVRNASTELAQHRQGEAALTAAVERAVNDHAIAEQQAAAARKALEQAETAQSAQRPRIRRARELDHGLRDLQSRLDREHAALVEQQDLLNKSTEQLTTARTERDSNRRTVEAWPNWLDAQALFIPAAERWSEVGETLKAAKEALHLTHRAAQDHRQAERDAATARDALNELTQVKTKHHESARQARQAFDAASDEESAFDPASLDREQEQLTEQQTGLERLDSLLAEHRKLSAQREQQQTRQRQLEHDRDEQDRQRRELDSTIPAARARREQARQALQATRDIADQHTETLRRQLVDGEPCPVCGSTSHPGHPQSGREIADILAQLEAQLEQAEQRFERSNHDRNQLDANLRLAREQLDELQPAIEQTLGELTRCQDSLGEMADKLGLQADAPTALAAEALALRETLQARQTRLKQHKQALLSARKKRQKAEKALRKATDQLEKTETELKQLKENAQPLLDAVQTATETARIRRNERDAILDRLSELLTLEAPPDDDTLSNLVQCWQQGEALRQQADKAAQNRALLEQRVDELDEQCTRQRQQHDELQAICRDWQTQLDTARQQRREALEAEDVDAFEHALARAVSDAGEVLKTAASEHQLTRQKQSLAENNLHHWQQQHQTLERKTSAADQTLAEWLRTHEHPDRLGLERDDLAGLIALLEIPDAQWQPLRDELRQAEADIRRTTAVLENAERNLADWRAPPHSQRDRETVEQLLAETNEELETRRQQTADLRAERRTDDQRRQRTAEELENLRAQQAVLEQWKKLNELIGSADGSLFQRYAQQFTLDVLITHANAQLANLAPRYRLQRGRGNLGILVVDDDMGGELRGVHSLSGGETFLASLALALGLAELSSQRVQLESLFVDEGFGSLDADTLRVAMDALDRLQAQGRKVGVISHVQDMSDRIGVQIRVVRVSPGRSRIRVSA